MISEIAAETEESKQNRLKSEEKLKVLRASLDIMKKMQRLQPMSQLCCHDVEPFHQCAMRYPGAAQGDCH